jgi:hypothetical protein
VGPGPARRRRDAGGADELLGVARRTMVHMVSDFTSE